MSMYFVKEKAKEGVLFLDNNPYIVSAPTVLEHRMSLADKQTINTDVLYKAFLASFIGSYEGIFPNGITVTHIDTEELLEVKQIDSKGISYTRWLTPITPFEEFNEWGISNYLINITLHFRFTGNYTDKYVYWSTPLVPYPNQDTELPSYTVTREMDIYLTIEPDDVIEPDN